MLETPFTRTSLHCSLSELFSHDADTRMPGVVSDARLAGRRVLVVDDNEINRQVVCEILRHEGAEARAASGGREALAMLAHADFDGALVDIRMPDMDGFELAHKIRAQARGGQRRLPVIALSADSFVQGDDRAPGNIDDFLTKPIDPEELVGCVQSYLRYGNGLTGGDKDALLDSTAGLSRAAGNEELYSRLLRAFADSEALAATDVRHALECGDRVRAEAKLHNLKGVAANLGADHVARVADRLIDDILAGRDGEPSLTALAQAMVAVRLEIEARAPSDRTRDSSLVESNMSPVVHP